LKRKSGGQKERRSEQVWVRRPPILMGAVKPPPTELPYFFVSFEMLESAGGEGEMGLIDDIAKRKLVPIYTLERIFGREKMESLIKFLYEHFTLRQMANMLCRPYMTVREWVIRYKIPLRPPIVPFPVFKVVPEKILLEPYPRRFVYEDMSVVEYTILPSKELSYLFGYIVAEGNAARREVTITGRKLPRYEWELGDFVYEVARKVADELTVNKKKPTVSIYYRDEKEKHVPREKAVAWDVHIYSAALAHTFAFPRWYERLMKTMMKPGFFPPFLAGLWDGDGTFSYEKDKPGRIALAQEIHKEWWLKQVREALTERDIKVSLQGPYTKPFNFRHGEKVYKGEAPYLGLYIWRESWADFIRLIDPYQHHPVHKERAEEFLKFVEKGGGS